MCFNNRETTRLNFEFGASIFSEKRSAKEFTVDEKESSRLKKGVYSATGHWSCVVKKISIILLQ